MMLLFLLFSFFLLNNFWSVTDLKILILLYIEAFYLILLFYNLIFSSMLGVNVSFFITFLVMSVLDSIFGISLLICVSRESTIFSWNFFSI